TSCKNLNEKGVRINAITAWALFGSYGWNKLLTERLGDYESGVFDARNNIIRPTRLADSIKKICLNDESDHPVCKEKGWWQRADRLIYEQNTNAVKLKKNTAAQPVLIIGKRGTLGKAFKKICDERFLHAVALGREDCDISDQMQIEEMIQRYKPWAIINAAGYVRVDDAEHDAKNCFRDNTTGPHYLAAACEINAIKFVNFSSDLVFDGTKKSAYTESDTVNPLNVYGQSKAMAESLIINKNPDALIIRTSAFFGPWDNYSFVFDVYKKLLEGEMFYAARDMYVSPTYVPDLVHATLDLLIDDAKGNWHIANEGEISWAALATLVADYFELNKRNIVGLKADEMKFAAKRPYYSVLKSEKGLQLPKLEDALHRCLHHFQPEKLPVTVRHQKEKIHVFV
ncbi:MAG: SDR family oxidoreductase, partial [Chitinophagaceae bacterium]